MDPASIKIATEAAKELGVKELTPTVYQDVLQPAAREAGQQLLVVAKAVRIGLAPLEGLVWGYEQTKAYVSAKVAAKLASKPPKEIKPPDKTVAGPLLLNLAFADDAPHLKELYANLLANAMHSPTASRVHPSFVYVVQQITPAEAQVLKAISLKLAGPISLFTEKVELLRTSSKDDHAIIKSVLMEYLMDVKKEEKIAEQWSKFCTESGVTDPTLPQTFLRNLIRLGILAENFVKVSPNDLRSLLSSTEAESEGVLSRELRLTEYGNLFLDLCVRDEPLRHPEAPPNEPEESAEPS